MTARVCGFLMELNDKGRVVMCLDTHAFPYKWTFHSGFIDVSGLYTPSQFRYYMRAGKIVWI